MQAGYRSEALWHRANQDYYEIVQQLGETRLNELFGDEPAESRMEKRSLLRSPCRGNTHMECV